jgi:hypothetical protein
MMIVVMDRMKLAAPQILQVWLCIMLGICVVLLIEVNELLAMKAYELMLQ